MHYYQQLDMTDCGAACLAMVASHFGKSLNIAEVRSVAGTDVVGTSIMGMLKAAKNYGLTGRGVKGSAESITPAVPTPFIVHFHIERDEGVWADHFVVAKKITKKKIEIWNPDPLEKKKKIPYEEFFKNWTGYAIFFEPSETFKPSKKKKICF